VKSTRAGVVTHPFSNEGPEISSYIGSNDVKKHVIPKMGDVSKINWVYRIVLKGHPSKVSRLTKCSLLVL
jgi:hypothetical protein